MAKKKKSEPTRTSNVEDAAVNIPIPIPVTPTMTNTITLASDMSTLYLIEGNGRVIPYSLHAIGGVYVGLIGGQLTVVSALEPMPDPGNSPILTTSTRSATARTPIQRVKSLKVSTRSGQWTAFFIPKSQSFVIMGATDIDVSLKEDDELGVEGYLFDLREGYVNLRRSGDSIIAVSVAMKA